MTEILYVIYRTLIPNDSTPETKRNKCDKNNRNEF